MISKIKDSAAQMIQQYQKNDSAKKEGDKPVAAGATVATERVDLSARAKDIQQIKQILDQTPDVREKTIEELKRQIESGSYTINPSGIADKMLRESLIDLIV
jgi:negative regulator of flagellin synthesis FlgM